MFFANRIGYRCALFCAIALPSVDQLRAADDETNAPVGPGGSAQSVEKSVLSSNANGPIKVSETGQDFCKCINESDPEAVKRIEQSLRAPLHSAGLDFTETPLQEVVANLQDDYGIPIQLDRRAMEEIGIASDVPVTVNIHNVSLQAALRLMLNNLQLTYKITNDVLMITSPEEAEKELRICVYDVSSISGNRDSQLDSVIDTIASCVATNTWAKNGGGQAEIRPIKPGLLVISQTAATHEEIRDLIGTLRRMQSESKSNHTAAHDSNPSGAVVTRSYVLQIQPSDSEQARNQVRELILNSLPNETWSGRLGDGQAVTLNVIHDRVVVRQTPAVQEEVERILTDSGIAIPANSVTTNTGAFGGNGGQGGGGFGGGGGGGFFRPSTRSSYPAQRIQPGPAADDPFGE